MTQNRQTVLVADDDRSTRFLFRQMLEQDGLEVIEAANGEETISLCEKRLPDLILIDAMMPQMDGFTACFKIKKAMGEKQTPILMITSLDDDKIIDMAYEYGVVDFIIKPVHFGLLRHRIRQILKSRQTAMLLEKSIATEHSITNLIQDGIIIIDGEDVITSFNPSSEIIFDCKAADVTGKKINKLIPGLVPSKMKPDGSDDIEITNEHLKLKREILWRKKNGVVLPIEIKVDGAVSGDKFINIRDLTEKKQTESKARLIEKLFQNIAEAIVIIDNEENIQSINPAFTNITGYGEAQASGRHISFLKSDLDPDSFHKNIFATLERDGQWRGETLMKKADSSTFSASMLISLINDPLEKNMRQFVIIFHDISEQLKLRARQEALQKEAAKIQKMTLLSTVSAGIIHEINQPLNSIKILADGMLYMHKKGRELETSKVLENLQKISDQIVRVDDIIKHMRAFANMKHTHETMKCDINAAVEKALTILDQQLKAHKITFTKKLSGQIPKFNGNINILEEVVINLIVNAIQALDTVIKNDKEIICETVFEEGKIHLKVSDNAFGINNDIKEKIFEPFFSTKSVDGGMGLGLALVQTILSTYNGIIGVSNNKKGGATFTVELPPAETN